ncbi:E3 ubiquitin-protein ligase RNF25 [Chelonus insularis]|uniref:E3 ubiquitin-protein ligase RNF25 n=1 Tax=Chelonus insularis TaxID=460826 RepID=UPI00158CF293|nr:E3 ubiquitin-protein ligase RNF25 [Chelonus insularis]XP_034938747.1 E3 ubiquitin-protein ligase RNF25 [Chelonus insularis]
MSKEIVDERVTDEIEALCAILLDNELRVKKNENGIPEQVEILVFPSTGEDSQSQYVCITLVVHLPTGYPDVSPTISLRNPRGLDDDVLKTIQTETENKCKDFLGQPVMFELIELVREHLTQSNLPTDQCAICLYGFQDGDKFTKTECYHYFHSYCLAAHVTAAERFYQEEFEKLPQWQQDSAKEFQASCPVCREPISCDVKNLCSAPPPIDVESATEFALTPELQELQQQMSRLFLHQQQQGGIIDPEAEEIKMLLRTENSTIDAVQSINIHAGPSLTSLSAQSNINISTAPHNNDQVMEQKNSIQQPSSDVQNEKQCDIRRHNNHYQHNHSRRNRVRGRGKSNRHNNDRYRPSESSFR